MRAGFEAVAERLAAGLRAVDARAAVPADDLARLGAAFLAVLRLAVERLAVDRLAAVLRPPPLRADPEEVEPLLVLALDSMDHLPVITR